MMDPKQIEVAAVEKNNNMKAETKNKEAETKSKKAETKGKKAETKGKKKSWKKRGEERCQTNYELESLCKHSVANKKPAFLCSA